MTKDILPVSVSPDVKIILLAVWDSAVDELPLYKHDLELSIIIINALVPKLSLNFLLEAGNLQIGLPSVVCDPHRVEAQNSGLFQREDHLRLLVQKFEQERLEARGGASWG
jgi:hypothetical protein